ncbi:hypothetical protein [Aeoliella sp.]|uniref:hypothetical protein n=1 Tax=Aeoliella sp. TaxID=2795800 RepID=UPI003CCB8296
MTAFGMFSLASSYVAPANGPTSASATPYGWAVVVMAVLLLLTMLVCAWLVWRVRTLVRVVQQINDKEAPDVAVPGPLGFLRFKMRTMLIVFTLAAVVLGMFAAELSRARRQADALDRLMVSSQFFGGETTYYRLGRLGRGKLATLVNQWIHPHFGCHLTHLEVGQAINRFGQMPSHQVDLAALGSLRELVDLRIHGQQINEDDIEAIARLTNLNRLIITDSTLPTGVVQQLQQLEQLEMLELLSCNLEDTDVAGVARLKKLEELSLGFNALTDKSLVEIGQLPRLNVLLLTGNKVTTDGLEHLVTLPQLSQLSLSYTDVDQNCDKPLLDMPQLRYINLAGCNSIPIAEVDRLSNRLAGNTRLDMEWTSPRPKLKLEGFTDNRPTMPDWSTAPGGGAF